MDLELLQTTLADLGAPAYRARQVWRWVTQGVGEFAEDGNAGRRQVKGLPFEFCREV